MSESKKHYENYHKHSHLSIITTIDCVVKPVDYINRIEELGTTTYYTTEHGWGGDIFEGRKLCDEKNFKCVFALEGYIVKDPLELDKDGKKDKRNYHIIIIPKTNKARKKLNLASSRAHMEGYYFKPRLFLSDLLDFEPDDLYITTACIGGIVADDDAVEDIFKPLAKHFKKNLFVEVQAHLDPKQVEHNKRCVELARQYNLELVAGTDSHYIYPEQAKERQDYIDGKFKNKKKEQNAEDNFILDFPDYDTLYDRFIKQRVLSPTQIEKAMENTLLFSEVEGVDIDKTIKMPSLPENKDLTPEEKVAKLRNIVYEAFEDKYRKGLYDCDEDGYEARKKGIEEELQVIYDTREINTADYFLFNEKNVRLAVEKYGGILTRTGRGSAGAEFINNVLGMTQLDRFAVNIPLYPERFMSTARLLENHSLPDIDFNIVSQEPFVKASKELLGDDGVYPMIAYGTMKDGESFRNLCRQKDLPFAKVNEVGKALDKYKEDEFWGPIIEQSQKYVGTISSVSVHPCSFLLMDKNIKEEIGVIKVKDYYCAPITSGEADEWKYLKNDYLVVTVWQLISETCDKIGIPIPTINELMKKIDNKVWELYAKGLTCTLNQIDSDYATGLMTKYKAESLEELQMFVAALRPSFDAWRDDFIKKTDYKLGVKQLDDLLSSTHSFLLFQETLMLFFDWLGVTPAESIGLIKKISKKKIKPEDFEALETRIKKQWVVNTGSMNGFDKVWEEVQGCMAYGFAAPHALATAIDSLYGAYLKANYPLEYYTVCLNAYANDATRTKKLRNELSHFKIKLLPPRFGTSTDDYLIDKKNNTISKGGSSIKRLNKTACKKLYSLSKKQKFNSFIDLLNCIEQNKILHSDQIEILIYIDYFVSFGNSKTLMEIYKCWNECLGKGFKTQYKIEGFEDWLQGLIKKHGTNISEKTGKELKAYQVQDISALMKDVEQYIRSLNLEDYSYEKKMEWQSEYLGYIDLTTYKPEDRKKLFITDIRSIPDRFNGGIWKHRLESMSVGTGNQATIYCIDKIFSENKFKDGSIIYVKKLYKDNKGYWNLDDYDVIEK